MQIKIDVLIAQQMLKCRKHLSLSHCYIIFAAENGISSVCNSNRGQPTSACFCGMTPSPLDNLVQPGEASNLLWFSKSCARQFKRLPFSGEALHWVILRNPHLRLICRTKTSVRKPSRHTGSDLRAPTARGGRRCRSPLGPLCAVCLTVCRAWARCMLPAKVAGSRRWSWHRFARRPERRASPGNMFCCTRVYLWTCSSSKELICLHAEVTPEISVVLRIDRFYCVSYITVWQCLVSTHINMLGFTRDAC